MASAVEGRVEPHKKAHFSLHISEQITNNDASLGSYSSVKYNHKPAQTASTRSTTLTSTSPNAYRLKLQDEDGGGDRDIFTFTGQRTAPKRSYILLFEPSSQKATLEPLSSTYTFNLASKNNRDVSSSYTKIYPKKQKDDSQDIGGADELFDERAGDDDNDEPDPNNPFDFRHFLSKEKERHGDESEYVASSPDYRTGTGSAANTPQFAARKPAAALTSKLKSTQPVPKPKKRKSPEPEALISRKTTAKKAQAPPTVRLDRRATEDSKPARKTATKSTAPPASKIKSAEIVHSSDESDVDGEDEGYIASSPAAPALGLRSPSPVQQASYHEDEGEDDDDEDMSGVSGLEIEVPDARPKPKHNALASLGLGQNIGLGGLGHLKSPSNGPISLVSAANSVEGSPNPHNFTPRKNRNARQDDEGVIDFGNLGGDDEEEEEEAFEDMDDKDVEPMDIGPPVQQQAPARRMSVGGMAVEEDEDDPLYKEMMEGLAGGDSSEESEEE